MKKLIFLFLAICMVLVLPNAAIANSRAGPESQAQTQFVNSTPAEIVESPRCAIAKLHQTAAARIETEWKTTPINVSQGTNESRMINIMTPSSFVRDHGIITMTILSRGAQKTKFPHSTLSGKMIYPDKWATSPGHLKV